jgi:glucose-6-phosphate isomerase
MPLTLALLSLWNTNFLDAATEAMLPYSQSLHLFPAYLQQLEMESNGKQIDRDGQPLGIASSPVIWGESGTNGQHSFYQLFHQGGRTIPCDFVALREADFPLPGHHISLLANCLAQSAALAFGQTADEVAPPASAKRWCRTRSSPATSRRPPCSCRNSTRTRWAGCSPCSNTRCSASACCGTSTPSTSGASNSASSSQPADAAARRPGDATVFDSSTAA